MHLHEYKWELTIIQFDEDTLLMVYSKEKLRDLVSEFDRRRRGKTLRINLATRKVRKNIINTNEEDQCDIENIEV